MKKLDALILIILLTLTLAACGGTATPDTAKVFSPEENEALYDKYIRSIDTGMIFNSTWDDANEVDADYFMYYYAVELLHSGRSIFGENADGYIPAEELELFVQSHFDVNVEHLRTNEYYIADKNVYEFGGLGSAWYCDITAAEKKGKMLTIKYDVIGPMDYARGRGVLNIELNGENYKYLSNEYETTAQSYLDYPNSNGIVDNKGILMMDSGGGTVLGNPELNIHEYSGNKLSDIIYYYENVALPELEAQGSTDTGKYADGWYWSGTYRGGKPLTIDIQRRYGADTYIITALYEAKANPNVADYMRRQNFMQPPGLNDFDQLSSLYFWRPYYAGVLGDTWSIAENANVPSLVALYALNVDFTGDLPETSFSADDVESYVQKYFDISADTMRGWNVYDRDKNEYTYTPADVTTVCDIVSATSYGSDDDGATKIMITYEIHRSEDDDTMLCGGELTIELSGNGYKYISNDKYYDGLDFTDALGFKVILQNGPPMIGSELYGANIADMVFQLDKSNIAHFRVAVDVGESIEQYNPRWLEFETEKEVDINGVAVNISYNMSGPMSATWSKNGYAFNFYMNEGETELSVGSFRNFVEWCIKDVVLEPTTITQ